MRSVVTLGQPESGQQPTIEPLAVSAAALLAHAKLLATEASTTQVAQLPFNAALLVTDALALDDPAISRTVQGRVTVVEHLIDQGLAVTRLEVAPYS